LFLEGHTDYVSSVVFSPDGTKIVSGSGDRAIHIWDAEAGNIISGQFESHTNLIMSECVDEGHYAQEAENRCLSFTIPKSDCQVVVFHFLFH
jgi:WD40 repeat protein